ncbi:3-hydroxyacyl-ACP dehydratase FabZ family protein [Algisphaera agarilytica]|uniref:3-hydroxyacyl-[acyl-carrier-protein] dehydratase n=1 Tax=Algisphaera agarilytica TaxID=1385975 RepID=A0A7X0H6H1_9BACT|nr:3-hydroxyacyl-ACP dehydratase FabZ family protein [Algisphaera agarilytica]MBB6430178.1 3-hydroxyacyl-[acyl-carrier-protein] dehydratase [Algisphaera agarilytica]
MTQAQLDDLLTQLPHGDGFRFVDRITELDAGKSGSGVWSVDGTESFFAGHFPGNPIVPGVLLGEALAQMAGLVALTHADAEQHAGGQLAQIDLRLKRPVVPPAEIELHATLVRNVRILTHFDVIARCDSKLVAKGSLTIATVMKDAL